MLIYVVHVAKQAVFEARLKDTAMAVPLMCCAADMLSVPSRKQVVLVGHKPSLEFDNMLVAAHAQYDPNKTVSDRVSFSISSPLLIPKSMSPLRSWIFCPSNVTRYYFCRLFTSTRPTRKRCSSGKSTTATLL